MILEIISFTALGLSVINTYLIFKVIKTKITEEDIRNIISLLSLIAQIIRYLKLNDPEANKLLDYINDILEDYRKKWQ